MSDADHRAAAPLIVGVGEILWDVLPSGRVLGGAPANLVSHARRLGARGAMISAVGDDEPGRLARHELELLGVDHSGVATVAEYPTGTVDIAVGSDGEPVYRIAEPAAWDFIQPDPKAFELAGSANAICYGSLAQRGAVSRGTIRALIDAAPRSCFRVLDVNLRPPWVEADVLVALLERSDVVKLNESELDVLTDILALRGGQSVRIEQLAARTRLRLVAVTKGSAGCRLFADGEHAEHDGFAIDAVVDTVGAGDAFTAALIFGICRGLPLHTIAQTSNRLASQVCRQAGATASTGSAT